MESHTDGGSRGRSGFSPNEMDSSRKQMTLCTAEFYINLLTNFINMFEYTMFLFQNLFRKIALSKKQQVLKCF